jgi:hypothetical protein
MLIPLYQSRVSCPAFSPPCNLRIHYTTQFRFAGIKTQDNGKFYRQPQISEQISDKRIEKY